MARITRRSFIESAVAIGATAAWSFATPAATKSLWTEQREFFPEGVASGDPDSSSVLLWTRHSPNGNADHVTVEVADDPSFARVVAQAHAPISPASDWPCRVLVVACALRRFTGIALLINTGTVAASGEP
jgi:alkaline phosphatase D